MWSNNDSSISMQNEGGYMDTTTTAGNNSMSASTSTNLNRGQNCIPVMIAHLNRHGDNLKIWGVHVRIVTFVAIVEKVEAVSTKVTFQFRDETGTIKGIKWLNAEIIDYMPPVNINAYAKVHGQMRNQNNDNFILIMDIQPIEHVNELLAHLMEVTLVCMESERIMNQVAHNDSSFVNRSMQMNTTTSNMSAEIKECPSGLTRDQVNILHIIQHSDPEFGAERDEIKAQLPAYIAAKVDDILEFLSAEGHVYTTKTDDYFKVI